MLLDGPKYAIRESRASYKSYMWLVIRSFSRSDIGTYNCVATNSLGRAEGTLRLYEIKVYPGISRGSLGSHVSIPGGVAEAARDKDASRDEDSAEQTAETSAGVRTRGAAAWALLLLAGAAAAAGAALS